QGGLHRRSGRRPQAGGRPGAPYRFHVARGRLGLCEGRGQRQAARDGFAAVAHHAGRTRQHRLCAEHPELRRQGPGGNTSTGQDGKDLEELKGVTIPVLISGPFEKPVYTVQWRGAVTDVLKRSLERKLKEAVEQKAGGSKLAPQLDKALKGILGK